MDSQAASKKDEYSDYTPEFKRDGYDDLSQLYAEKKFTRQNAIERIYDSAGELTDHLIPKFLDWNTWFIQNVVDKASDLTIKSGEPFEGDSIMADDDYRFTAVEYLASLMDETDYLCALGRWTSALSLAGQANEYPAVFREVLYDSYLGAMMDFAKHFCSHIIALCGEIGWTSRYTPGFQLFNLDNRALLDPPEPIGEKLLMDNFHDISKLVSDSDLVMPLDLNYLGHHLSKERMRVLKVAKESNGHCNSEFFRAIRKTFIEGLELILEGRTVIRDNAEVSFESAPKRWKIIESLIDAGPEGVTREMIREKLNYSVHDDNALQSLKDETNLALQRLEVKIVCGRNNWRLADLRSI